MPADASRVERRLGFGCASLFGLPSARERRALLETAYDLGIRHFDAAPIYGLGLAEPELGRFVRSHPDVRVATKFGLALTPVGRLAGKVQGPVRRALRRSSGVRTRVKQSGESPSAGTVGTALYRQLPWTPDVGRECLETSLRRLGLARIDYLLLHEPAGSWPTEPERLVRWLIHERDAGRIGAWGPAGELPGPAHAVSLLYSEADVVQQPYRLGEIVGAADDEGRILFGFLARTLPLLRAHLSTSAALRDGAAQLLGRRLEESDLPGLLLRDAVRAAGPRGRVLLSSTNPANLRALVDALDVDLPQEEVVLRMLAEHIDSEGAA